MYKFITNEKELNYTEFFKNLGEGEVIGLDCEASSLDPFTATWILLQIKIREDIYIFDARNLEHKFLSYIVSLINSSQKPVIGHNIKYDLKILYLNTGVLIRNVHDTLMIESFLNKGKESGKVFYSLSELTDKYTGNVLDKEIRESFFNFTGSVTAEQLSYSALDVLYLNTIYRKQMLQVAENKLEKIYRLEMDLVPVISIIELNGIYLDTASWKALEDSAKEDRQESYKKLINLIVDSIDYTKFHNGLDLADFMHIPVKTKRDRQGLEAITDSSLIKEWVGKTLNINSPKQLLTILNDAFGLDLQTTNEKELLDCRDDKIIPTLLSYREMNKKITTYGSEFLENINTSTGRIHTEFLQQGTVSGRLSSNNPNMQNIPREEKYRNAFKAQLDDWFIASWDYSQQEYRLAGAIPKDPIIMSAYCNGKDMHSATAALIFNKSIDDITKEERSLGKTINFAVLYGSTAWGLAFKMKVDPKKAEEFLELFHNGYPTLSSFKKAFEDAVWKKKVSSTVLGRKRFFEEKILFRDSNELRQYEGKVRREGFNHLIQGTGADITKLAMIKMFNDNPFGSKFRIILQIHDEIVAEVHDSVKDDALAFGKKCMLDVFQPFLGEVPAAVDSHLSKYWSK